MTEKEVFTALVNGLFPSALAEYILPKQLPGDPYSFEAMDRVREINISHTENERSTFEHDAIFCLSRLRSYRPSYLYEHTTVSVEIKTALRDLMGDSKIDQYLGATPWFFLAVPEDGFIFHLGDFANGNAHFWNDILSIFPERKYLILGNHDMRALRQSCMDKFEFVAQQMTIRVGDQSIILNHNPFLCYGGSYRDVWQLFGHVHSGPASNTGLDIPRLKMLFPLQYDVGVDNNNFRPVSFAEVKAKIESQIEAARALVGIQADNPDSANRRIVFLDDDTSIGPFELSCLKEVATDIIRLGSADFVPVKEAIASRISLLTGNTRYVYIGSRPLDDFRYVPVKTGAAVSMDEVDAARKIL